MENIIKKVRAKNNLISTGGFSLVMALAALGMLSAASYYVIGLNKNNAANLKVAKSVSFFESERKRISANLADKAVCLANFGTYTSADLTPADIRNKNNIPLLTKNNFYGGTTPGPVAGNLTGNLKLTKIIFGVRKQDPPLTAGATTPYDYTLILEYTEWDLVLNTARQVGLVGLKHDAIKRVVLPMMVLMKAGVVANCYSAYESTDLSKAIDDSCSPLARATPADRTSLLDIQTVNGVSIANTCTHDANFAATTPTIPTIVPSTGEICDAIATVPTRTTLFNSVNINVTQNLDFAKATNCTSFASNCLVHAGAGETVTGSATEIVGAALTCTYAGTDPAATCPADSFIFKTGAGANTCATVNCGGQTLVNEITSTTATCVTAPAPNSMCASGFYIIGVDASNNATCARYSVLSKTCAVGSFGSTLIRTSGSTNLQCSAYTKTKACASPGIFTFAQSFNTGTTAGCQTFP